jgi:myo-inositol-1-phosphate synthase
LPLENHGAGLSHSRHQTLAGYDDMQRGSEIMTTLSQTDRSPLGVWLIGARGAVATTTIVGATALRLGRTRTVGLVTEMAPLHAAPFAPIDTLAFGGHDITDVPLVKSAHGLCRDFGPLSEQLVRSIEAELASVDKYLSPAPDLASRTPAQFVRDVQRDLAAFRAATGGRRVVVVNVATTEPVPSPGLADLDLPGFARALETCDARLPVSALYAYAALDAGMPYINFTPSVGAALPALERLAQERGVPHAGRDGKTGETLLKSALAPMFRMRHLEVKSWVGFNVLGNNDGLALSDPATAASKTESKGRVIPAILGYEPHTLVRIDYVPTLGDWKTAWDLVQFEGFLGTPMTLQLTWQGSDSALAAPLVLDLVRLVDLATDRGERGGLGHLGFFFKSPVACDVHDLSGQYALLCRHVLAAG